jgi:hypothetical protein
MRETLERICAFAVLVFAHSSVTLAHWPDQPPHQFADLGEFEFEGGGKIPNLRMSYVTHPCPIAAGATSTRRTLCAFTHCAGTTWG